MFVQAVSFIKQVMKNTHPLYLIERLMMLDVLKKNDQLKVCYWQEDYLTL